MQGHVLWSIYVRTSSVRKLKGDHIPPIEEALDGIEFPWEILREEDQKGIFRLVTYQNLHGECVEDLILPVLKRAYRLNSWWQVGGLRDLDAGQLRQVMGMCSNPPVKPVPPALYSMMFEILPGRMLGQQPEGGWFSLKTGYRVRFVGDMEELLAGLPEGEASAIRQAAMERQPFTVGELMAGGLIEIELPLGEEKHFFYVSAGDLEVIEGGWLPLKAGCQVQFIGDTDKLVSGLSDETAGAVVKHVEQALLTVAELLEDGSVRIELPVGDETHSFTVSAGDVETVADDVFTMRFPAIV